MNTRFDRLSLLATFVRIAERGSLSGAARDLGVSQPSVSRQLAALEALMDAALVRRSTHSLSLTPDGATLLAEARRMLGEWEELEERLAGKDGELRGVLRIVAPVALGQRLFLRAVTGFAREHPKVSFEWRLTDQTIRFTEEGCDVWIRVGPVPDDTLVVRELARVERLVVAAPTLVETHADKALETWPWLALGPFEGNEIALTADGGSRHAFRIRPVFATDNIFALREAVEAGLGAAIMPRWLVGDSLADGTLVDAAPELRAAELPVNIALAAGTSRPSRVERFAAALADCAKENL